MRITLMQECLLFIRKALQMQGLREDYDQAMQETFESSASGQDL